VGGRTAKIIYKRYNMRILMTTIEFHKLLRYSGAFRERAWLGRAHRQLPMLYTTQRRVVLEKFILFTLASAVCFEF
jgi:hypothetical protein